MIVTDPEKVRKLKQEQSKPYLPMLSFDIQSVCKAALMNNFKNLRIPINIYFVENGTLACIAKHDAGADIFIHVMLNDPSTPIQVCTHIVTHELIHLIVPVEIIDGKETYHTETFWKNEMLMIPDRSASWSWIWRNFQCCLLRDKKNECVHVKKTWKRLANTKRYSWKYCKSLQTSFNPTEATL